MQIQTLPKALIAAAVGGVFAVGASTAFAQDTLDLAVKGTIVPAACSANFTGGDTVDFGTIKVVDLLPNSYNLLGTKDTALNVTCSSAKRVTYSLTDAQSSSKIADAAMYALLNAVSDPMYVNGLGATTVNGSPVNLGGYAIRLGAPTVDSTPRTSIFSANNGSTWSTALQLENQNLFSAGNGNTPVSGVAFSFPLKITAAVNKGSALQVAQDTPLNGQAVFTINYQ